jgi:hypothetical protein
VGLTLRLAIVHAAALAGIAFVLHFSWEMVQCSQFVHVRAPATVAAMVLAAGGDLLLTGLAHGIVAVAARHWLWSLDRWTRRDWMVMEAVAVVAAVVVEWHGLSTGRWAYAAGNPVVPDLGVSVLPVLQLMLLFPVSFALTRLVVRRVFA